MVQTLFSCLFQTLRMATAENKHLKGMLMAHLDIIQQQSETIVSKDKMLKALREETGPLRQKLSRMTRRAGDSPAQQMEEEAEQRTRTAR
jgi:male-specific lethal 1